MSDVGLPVLNMFYCHFFANAVLALVLTAVSKSNLILVLLITLVSIPLYAVLCFKLYLPMLSTEEVGLHKFT